MAPPESNVVLSMDVHLGIEVEDTGSDAGPERYRAWLTVDRARTAVTASADTPGRAEQACREQLERGLGRLVTGR